MKLLNFEGFLNMKAINENEDRIENSIDERLYEKYAEELITEAFSSHIMDQLVKGDVKRGKSTWAPKFQVDLMKKYGISISEIKDTDFTVLTDSSAFFKRPYKDDTNYIGFCINDDPEVMARAKTNGPVLVAIVGGGRSLFFGFTGEKSEWRLGPNDKYGAIADWWAQTQYLGLSGRGGDMKPTNAKWVQEATTKVYVINVEELKQKYNLNQKRGERASIKGGAIAMMSQKDLKRANELRYKELISQKLTPEYVFEVFKQSFDKTSQALSAWVNSIDLDKDYEKTHDLYRRMSSKSPTAYLDRMFDKYIDYIRSYREYKKLSNRIERYSGYIESGKDENGAELNDVQVSTYQKNLQFYQDDLKHISKSFVEYKQAILSLQNDINKALDLYSKS